MSVVGAVERFQPGEYDRVERVLDRMERIGMKSLRLPVPWPDPQRADATHWLQWLVQRLAQQLEVIPCPGPGGASSASETCPDEAAMEDFIEQHGQHFEWVEVGDGGVADRRRLGEVDWDALAAAAKGAARAARAAGKKVVLGGSFTGPAALERLFEHGLMAHVDAVTIDRVLAGRGHADWHEELRRVQDVLDRHASRAEVWLGCGYATLRHDGLGQVHLYAEADALHALRVYWHGLEDAAGHPPHADVERRRAGLWRQDGSPKLLAQLLLQGRHPSSLDWLVQEEALPVGPGHIVITGGAGFVGTNLAHRLLQDGREVLVYDNLDRQGSLANLEWLRQTHGNALRVRVADVRDMATLERSIAGAAAVFHLAAQVAVTTSMRSPRTDFAVNAAGTLNVLEAVRHRAPDAFLLYASTNKVYGAMDGARLIEKPTRWEMKPTRNGHKTLSFATPYGCSKGAADQYVVDYARTFGISATSFRMSCIYGPMQNGTADQGWVAHFLRCARDGETLTIYGDGKQVRDMLHVDDLVDAYIAAMGRPDAVAGRAWDIGGGPHNTSSLVELLATMEEIGCSLPPVRREPARPSDQLVYVADNTPLEKALGWRPTISVREGVERVWRTMAGRMEVVA